MSWGHRQLGRAPIARELSSRRVGLRARGWRRRFLSGAPNCVFAAMFGRARLDVHSRHEGDGRLSRRSATPLAPNVRDDIRFLRVCDEGGGRSRPKQEISEETDFGQSRFGHPDLTNFGQSNFVQSIFGHRGFGPANFGQSVFGSGVCHGGAPKGVGPKPRKKWGPK